jgi:DNA-binding response OmpR family regulator
MATLLLVDDDPDQLAVRTLVLEREGYKVLAGTDVAGALAHRDADLVIMDLVPDALSLIASIGSRAPIIVLTGRNVADLPVARVLRKPCRTRVLLETIAEVLAER